MPKLKLPLQDGSLQVPRLLLAKVHPTWVGLLGEQSDATLMLPQFLQDDVLKQVTVWNIFTWLKYIRVLVSVSFWLVGVSC